MQTCTSRFNIFSYFSILYLIYGKCMGGHADRPMTDCVSLHMWLVRWNSTNCQSMNILCRIDENTGIRI